MARTGGEISASFSTLKAATWSTPHSQQFFFERRSRRALSFSDSWGMNFPTWFTIPRKLLNSLTFVGSFMSLMASVFSGSGLMPDVVMTCPRNTTSLLESSHLSAFKVTPACSSFFNKAWRRASCCSWSFPHTSRSSMWQTTPSSPSITSAMTRWKCSGAELIPNGRRWK